MNTSRLLTALLCLACGGAGYYLGRTPVAAPAAARMASPAPAAAATTPGPDGADAATLATLDRGKDQPRNVRAVIAQARTSMGSGLGMFVNIRGLFRALAPLAELSVEEVQQALAEVEQSVKEPQQKMMFYSMLLTQWAETDGAAAMAYAKEKTQGAGPMMGGISMQVAGTWARQDPEAAWKWWQGIRDSGERTIFGGPEGYLGGIFSGLAASSMDTAFARLATLQDEEKQSAIQGITMSATDSRSREALLARAAGLAPELKNTIYRNVTGGWMMSDPNAALAWMETLPAEDQASVAGQAGQTLMWTDPARGAELQLKHSSTENLAQTYAQITTQWAARDPQAAGEWLNRQPAGPQLDQARSSFAFTIAERDPVGAFEWARAVSDDAARETAYTGIYSRLRSKGVERADAALDAAGLPADLAAKIRQAAPGAGAPATPRLGRPR